MFVDVRIYVGVILVTVVRHLVARFLSSLQSNELNILEVLPNAVQRNNKSLNMGLRSLCIIEDL